MLILKVHLGSLVSKMKWLRSLNSVLLQNTIVWQKITIILIMFVILLLPFRLLVLSMHIQTVYLVLACFLPPWWEDFIAISNIVNHGPSHVSVLGRPLVVSAVLRAGMLSWAHWVLFVQASAGWRRSLSVCPQCSESTVLVPAPVSRWKPVAEGPGVTLVGPSLLSVYITVGYMSSLPSFYCCLPLIPWK